MKGKQVEGGGEKERMRDGAARGVPGKGVIHASRGDGRAGREVLEGPEVDRTLAVQKKKDRLVGRGKGEKQSFLHYQPIGGKGAELKVEGRTQSLGLQ